MDSSWLNVLSYRMNESQVPDQAQRPQITLSSASLPGSQHCPGAGRPAQPDNSRPATATAID
jgi:hypothetical protein